MNIVAHLVKDEISLNMCHFQDVIANLQSDTEVYDVFQVEVTTQDPPG